MDFEDRTQISVCIGTFDGSGIPIAIAKHLSDCATIAFQTITLSLLVSRCLDLDTVEVAYVYSRDGSCIKIERTAKGFTGYLETYR